MLSKKRKDWFQTIGMIFVTMIVLTILTIGVGVSGWQSGAAVQKTEKIKIWEENLDRQLELARIDSNKGDERLALQRLNWILEQDENHSGATLLYAAIQQKLAVSPTAVRSTPTKPAQLDFSDEAVKFAELEEIESLLKWEQLIHSVISFQHQYPSYRRWDTDRMLYQAYIEQGLILVQGEQAELGINYLNRAEKLGDVTEEVNNYRIWGRLYLDGIAFYGVDWGITINYFSDLCWVAPFYQNSCSRLYEAMIAYGDQYAAQLDWCQAVDWYREANQVTVAESDLNIGAKIEESAAACLLATPTPEIISGTVPITDTIPVDGIELELP